MPDSVPRACCCRLALTRWRSMKSPCSVLERYLYPGQGPISIISLQLGPVKPSNDPPVVMLSSVKSPSVESLEISPHQRASARTGLPKPALDAIIHPTGTIRRNNHAKTTELPHLLRLWHRQPDRAAPGLLHRRPGAVHRPVPAQTRAPGLPRSSAWRNHIHPTGHPYPNCCTPLRSRCMTAYDYTIGPDQHPAY